MTNLLHDTLIAIKEQLSRIETRLTELHKRAKDGANSIGPAHLTQNLLAARNELLADIARFVEDFWNVNRSALPMSVLTRRYSRAALQYGGIRSALADLTNGPASPLTTTIIPNGTTLLFVRTVFEALPEEERRRLLSEADASPKERREHVERARTAPSDDEANAEALRAFGLAATTPTDEPPGAA